MDYGRFMISDYIVKLFDCNAYWIKKKVKKKNIKEYRFVISVISYWLNI